MSKTDLSALNDMLFQQMEAVMNPDLTDEELKLELERSKTVSGLSAQIINSAATQLRAAEFVAEYKGDVSVPKDIMRIEGGKE